MALIGHDQGLMSSAFFKCRFNAARGYRTACAFGFARTWGLWQICSRNLRIQIGFCDATVSASLFSCMSRWEGCIG